MTATAVYEQLTLELLDAHDATLDASLRDRRRIPISDGAGRLLASMVRCTELSEGALRAAARLCLFMDEDARSRRARDSQ
jgi:hypothetical protein